MGGSGLLEALHGMHQQTTCLQVERVVAVRNPRLHDSFHASLRTMESRMQDQPGWEEMVVEGTHHAYVIQLISWMGLGVGCMDGEASGRWMVIQPYQNRAVQCMSSPCVQ